MTGVLEMDCLKPGKMIHCFVCIVLGDDEHIMGHRKRAKGHDDVVYPELIQRLYKQMYMVDIQYENGNEKLLVIINNDHSNSRFLLPTELEF